MKNILVIKLGAFGDIIMSDGVMRDIRENFPDGRISVLTTPAYKKIFHRCPWVDEVLVDPRDPRWRIDLMLKLNRDIEFDKFDLIIDLQHANRSSFYFRWFVKKALWSGIASGSDFLYKKSKTEKFSVMEEFASQIKGAGLIVRHSLVPNPEWLVADVDDVLKKANITFPYVVLLPGASAGHDEKCWPYYKELADELTSMGVCTVTVPGPDDLELCADIPAIMLTGDGQYLDFFDLAGVIKKATFVVGNDSGPSHLASHLKVPGVALFGAEVPSYRTGIMRGDFSCIEKEKIRLISVDEVVKKIGNYS